MGREKRPQAVVTRIRGCFGGGGLAPNAVGDEIGQEAIKLFVRPAMDSGNWGSTQDTGVFVKKLRRKGVKEAAIQHGVDNAGGRTVQVVADHPGDNDVRVDNADGLGHGAGVSRPAANGFR